MDTEQSLPVIPGIKYGIYCCPDGTHHLIPSCRSIDAMLEWLQRADEGECVIKLPEDIGSEDRAQRGPDGEPLRRVTPLVPFTTRKEHQR